MMGLAKDWIKAVEPTAFGVLGMTPGQLWDTTPAEFLAIVRARYPALLEKNGQEIENKAKNIDIIMQSWGKQ